MKFARYDRVRVTIMTGEIQVLSAYYHCSICTQSRWPVVDPLGWGPGGLSEGARRVVAQAGAIIGGFEQLGEVLHRVSRLRVSDSTIRRVTQEVGHALREKQQVAQAWQNHHSIEAERSFECLHIAVEGTTI